MPLNGKAAGSHNQHIIGTTPSKLLPSFAAFREHTHRFESVGGYKTASMATRSPCPRCSQLDLIVKELAVAAAELDDTVQSYCNKTFTRSVNVPYDDLSHTAHWILDRLRHSKFDLQEASQRSNSFHQVQQQHNAHSLPSRKHSSPNPFKRPAESWERDDLQGSKRFQSGASAEYQLASRDPNTFPAKDFRPGNCSPPDSMPGSALPRLTSPSFGGGGTHRTLPSPSSLAYPSSAAPSLPPLNSTQSTSSPATSGQQPSTIHSASSSSATLQHIADLQHQVTLKSMALQTLQSEYASLLQKLQREHVKSQTIERKTSVADQEVDDLTAKNEELSEQVRTLESQLEESERKRDDQRLEAAKEKEQWGRMLEMSGRLQNKLDVERQRLLEEKTYLTQRIAMLEDDGGQRNGEHAKRGGGQQTFGSDYHSLAPATKLGQMSGFVPVQSATHTTSSTQIQDRETVGHAQEVLTLRARVNALRTALEEVRRHNEALEVSARGFLEHTGLLWSNVSRALDHDLSQDASTRHANETAPSGKTKPWTLGLTEGLRQRGPTQAPSTSRPHGTLEIIKDGKRSPANIGAASRGSSARPQEMGFDVPPTTSSPEELIKALGPVPTSLPPFQYVAPTPSWTSIVLSSQNDKSSNPISAFAQHARNIPAGYIGHHRPAATSPQSHHSSPAEDRVSSAPEIGRHSPVTYKGELEPSTPRPATSQSVLTARNGFQSPISCADQGQ